MKAVLLASLLAVTALAAPSEAAAKVYSGTVYDREKDGKYAATDVDREVMTFDTSSGTWTTQLRFRGNVTAMTNARIFLSFHWQPRPGAEWDVFYAMAIKRDVAYEIAVKNGKMTFVDRTLGMFGCTPKVTLSRPGKVLLAKTVSPCMTGVIPTATLPTRLTYKATTQDEVGSLVFWPLR